jgi:hypothetical protein
MTEPSFLEVIFIPYLCVDVYSADINGDGLLSLQELSDWISKKIQEHINEALRENFGLFVSIDNNPRNGRLIIPYLYILIIAYSETEVIHTPEHGGVCGLMDRNIL